MTSLVLKDQVKVVDNKVCLSNSIEVWVRLCVADYIYIKYQSCEVTRKIAEQIMTSGMKKAQTAF